MVRREVAPDRRAEAEHRAGDDRRTVDRLRDRTADARIVKRWTAVVHRQDCFAFGRTKHDRETWICVEHRDELRRGEVREHLDIAGLKRCCGRCGIGYDAECRALQRDRVAPVVVVADKGDARAANPPVEGEGPRPDGTLPVRLRAFRRDDHRVAPSELVGQRTIGPLQADLDLTGVKLRHGLDRLEERFLGIHGIVSASAIQREHDVLGVERRSVVERHAVAQFERVRQPVVGHVPAFGERGLNGAIAVDPRQPFEHVGVDDLIDRSRRPCCWVEVWRFQRDAERQVRSRSEGRNGKRECA